MTDRQSRPQPRCTTSSITSLCSYTSFMAAQRKQPSCHAGMNAIYQGDTSATFICGDSRFAGQGVLGQIQHTCQCKHCAARGFTLLSLACALPKLSRCAICGSNTAGCERSMLPKGKSCAKGKPTFQHVGRDITRSQHVTQPQCKGCHVTRSENSPAHCTGKGRRTRDRSWLPKSTDAAARPRRHATSLRSQNSSTSISCVIVRALSASEQQTYTAWRCSISS